MPKVGAGKPAAKNPNVGQNKPAPKNPNVGKGKALPNGGGGSNPAAPANPGTPGIPNPVVNPFMTGEDIMAFSRARQEYESGLSELDYKFATASNQSAYEKDQITKGAKVSASETNEDMAGRGLYRSSIRDADLFDISATAELKKQFLDTQINTLKLNTEAQKHALDVMWNDPETGYMHGLQLKEVANAQSASEGMPQWAVPPTPPSPPSQPKGPNPKNPNGPTENKTIHAPGTGRGNGGTTAPGGNNRGNGGTTAPKNIKGKLA